MPIIATSEDWNSFLNINDVKAWLNFPSNASDAQDSNLQLIVDMACEFVGKYTNHPINVTYTERHDGWAGSQIMLNYYPIIELISATEFLSFGGTIDLPESTPENPVDGVQLNYLTGQINRVFQGYSWPRPFFPGQRNVEVTYIAGYNPVPPMLKTAALELVKHWWVNTQQASRQNQRPTEFDPGDTQNSLWQGVPYRIIALLDPYRRVVIG
jgi:hypothetical protein